MKPGLKANDMIESLLTKAVQDYITSHETEDIRALLLKHKTIHGVPAAMIADQIAVRRKAKHKLPVYFRTQNIVYPPPLSFEQCSSEVTAKFKAMVLRSRYGGALRKGADLTGGLGVDTLFICQHAAQFDYVEPDPYLLAVARHNHLQLGAHNITYHQASTETFLSDTRENYDFLYIDPSRRIKSQKTYRLSDALPDVVQLQGILLEKAMRVLIKASPLLDLSIGLSELRNVSAAVVVAVENECRELLFLLEREAPEHPNITAVNLERSGEVESAFTFTMQEEKDSTVAFSEPMTYLYEPNSAILKAGAFKWIALKFGLNKLAPSTHLYTSNEIVDGFPGRIFKTLGQQKLDKKLKKAFPDGQINIISRNHPLSVADIMKKTGLKEGGGRYLICARSSQRSLALLAERIK